MNLPLWAYIGLISGGVVIIVGQLAQSWFKIQNQTNALLKEQNNELREANKDLQCKNETYLQQLSGLQGQVDMLKSIPLVSIDDSLKKLMESSGVSADSIERLVASIEKLLIVNTKMLDRLNKDARVLAHDTTAAAQAVQKVKADLASK
jgi:hypothetical protein